MSRAARSAGLRRRIAVAVGVWLVMAAAPAIGLYIMLDDYLRRDAILAGGVRAIASIDRERHGESRTGGFVCTTQFSHVVAGVRYRGERRGCGGPNRTSLAIAYDPADPGGAFAVAEGRWRGDSKGPAALLAIILALVTAGFVYIVRDMLRDGTKDEAG